MTNSEVNQKACRNRCAARLLRLHYGISRVERNISHGFGCCIISIQIQLAFRFGNECRCCGSTDDIGGGAGHIRNAGDGGEENDHFHRQTGCGEERGCNNGCGTGNADSAYGNQYGQQNQENILQGRIGNLQHIDGEYSQQHRPYTGAAGHTQIGTQTCSEGSHIFIDTALLQLGNRNGDRSDIDTRIIRLLTYYVNMHSKQDIL